MAKKSKKPDGGAKRRNGDATEEKGGVGHRLHPETKRSIWAVAFIGVALVLVLAHLHRAGPVGEWIFSILSALFGWGGRWPPWRIRACDGQRPYKDQTPAIQEKRNGG